MHVFCSAEEKDVPALVPETCQLSDRDFWHAEAKCQEKSRLCRAVKVHEIMSTCKESKNDPCPATQNHTRLTYLWNAKKHGAKKWRPLGWSPALCCSSQRIKETEWMWRSQTPGPTHTNECGNKGVGGDVDIQTLKRVLSQRCSPTDRRKHTASKLD